MKKEFDRYKKLIERKGDLEQKRKDHCQIIDEFYNDDISQVENCGAPIKGKMQLMQIENKNLDGVNFVDTKIKDIIFDTTTELIWGLMIIRFYSKKNGKQRLEEAFMQKWSNGQIVYQRFFYGKMIGENE